MNSSGRFTGFKVRNVNFFLLSPSDNDDSLPVLDYPESISALWGLLQARFGVVYVKGFFKDKGKDDEAFDAKNIAGVKEPCSLM